MEHPKIDLAAMAAYLDRPDHSVDLLHGRASALLSALTATRADRDDADAALKRLGDQANHLVQQLNAAAASRQRIAEAHHKHVDGHGGTWGECNECGNGWPCPTYVWATTGRDPLATWDPADDEAAGAGDGEQDTATCGECRDVGRVNLGCAYTVCPQCKGKPVASVQGAADGEAQA